MASLWRISVTGTFALLFARSLPALLACYNEMCIPLVYNLRLSDGQLTARLGEKWAGMARTIPTIVHDDSTGWTEGPPFVKPERPEPSTCPPILLERNYAEGTDSEWQQTTGMACSDSGDFVWIATDLGVSMLDKESNRWRHWRPRGEPGHIVVEELSAETIHRELLGSVPRSCLMSDAFENQLVEGLAKFRPKFLHAWLKERPAAEWGCVEARFLATRLPDFQAFQRRLLRLLPGDSYPARCAIESFGEREHREPEWRAFLLQEASRGPIFARALRFFRNDAEVEKVLVANLSRPGRHDVARILPMVMGPRSVPILIEQLRNERILESTIITALERAVHQRIAADGTVTPLPSGSDRPWYDDLAPADDREFRDGEEEQQIAAAWLRWFDERRGTP